MTASSSAPEGKTPVRPVHPFWCDYCGMNASFKINGCAIPHHRKCPRAGEDAERVFKAAVEWCKQTGESIP